MSVADLKSAFSPSSLGGQLVTRYEKLEQSSQHFFADLDRETRKPHYGTQAREWGRALLIRAQGAGLYRYSTLRDWPRLGAYAADGEIAGDPRNS